ncbi:MAG: glycosyltransferase family 4 protein [Planctomycetes bacterium]|nr:glycosyltransferase family 4 protein [Planctomycetota bacterium]
MTKPVPPIRPRRILQVISPSRMSGAEMQLVRLTRRMQDRGHTLDTIVKRGSPAIPELHRLGLAAEPMLINGKANIAALAIIARRAARFGADLIQSTLSTASWWCGWVDFFGGPPTIGHVQGFTSATWHRRQTHLLAVSNAVKDHLVNEGIEPERITILYNALSPDDFRPSRDPIPVRAEFGADADTPIVGTFAHLSEKKGHRELFDAMPTVLRTLPATQFWIVGQGKLLDDLEAAARLNGVTASVRFLGFRRDVADLMHAIDVMALPSHREPCALVYVEAALARKPIIGCRAGGAPESIADGETGLLVPVRDSAAIAAAILTLLTNRDRAAQMGQAGYDRARTLFGWNRFVETLETVYERVLDEHGDTCRTSNRPAA